MLLISGEKMLTSAELKGCVTCITVLSFIIVGHVTDFKKGWPFSGVAFLLLWLWCLRF